VRRGFAIIGRRAENIPPQPEQLSVNDLGVKHLIAFLEAANGCHI